jgi:hypothetical protein
MGENPLFFKSKVKVREAMDAVKPRRVLIIGYPYFVNRIKELAANSSDYQFLIMPQKGLQRWWALAWADVIYLIGGDLRPNRFYKVAIFLRKKLIMHWVGSDILEMQEWQKKGRRFCPFLLKKAVHWAEVNWTANELKELGVKAQVVPLTPASIPAEVKELPVKFVALTYLPPGKELFYGSAHIVRLAEQYPEIVFLAVAASPTEPHPEWPANIIPVGWVDNMEELYREVTVLIRLTDHDGLSFMVLEALANGRYVIWSYPFDGVYQATEYSKLAQTIADLYQEFKDGNLPLNQSGRSFIEEHFQPQVVWQRINKGIGEVLS